MKKKIFLGLLLICFTRTFAQQMSINATVIDKQTKIPLSSASIYISANQGTISNQEGEFTISTSPTDTLYISYVGYETQKIKATNVSTIISLQPSIVKLKEIIINPLDLHHFLMRALSKYKNDYNISKNKTNSFFYRQISKTNAVCNEVIEAFFNAKPYLSISDIELVTGRYASIPSDSIHKYASFVNFFYESQLRPTTLSEKVKIKKDTYIQPLSKDYNKYYTVTYDILYTPNDTSVIYKISFDPRKGITNPIIKGNAFIDSSTLELKRFEGEVINNIIKSINHDTGEKNILKIDQTYFNINYRTEKNISLVESITVDMSYSVNALGSVKVHSIMYNTGDKAINKAKKLNINNNLLNELINQKYDPTFWKNNTVIKPTTFEKSVYEMFEKKNLFGTYSLEK